MIFNMPDVENIGNTSQVDHSDSGEEEKKISRRDFLKWSVAGVAALALNKARLGRELEAKTEAPEFVSHYFDPMLRNDFEVLGITPLENGFAANVSTLEGKVDTNYTHLRKYTIEEGSSIGNLGRLQYEKSDFSAFLGPKYMESYNYPHYGQITGVFFPLPSKFDNTDVVISNTAYSASDIHKEATIRISQKKGNFLLGAAVVDDRESFASALTVVGASRGPNDRDTFTDEFDFAVTDFHRLMSLDSGKLGLALFRQEQVKDADGDLENVLYFLGYIKDPKFKVSLDFQNLPGSILNLYKHNERALSLFKNLEYARNQLREKYGEK